MATSRHEGSLHVAGSLSCTTLIPSASSVGNSHFKSGAADRLAAAKSQQQHCITVELAEQGTAVVAIEKLIHVAKEAGTIVAIEAAVVTKATGADRSLSIDLQKGNSGASFATVLTGTIDIDDEDTSLQVYAGTINTAAYADADILKLVVTVSGAAGNQAEGLVVTVTLREDPE